MEKHACIEEIDRIAAEMKDVASYIFEHPELGFEEFKSSERLATFLEAHGFQVERGIFDMKTAFKATVGTDDGPTVAFLAEYDALPALGHACGHNLFGTAAAAAGIALARVLPKGKVIVFGTPAEEGGVEDAGGKIPMAEAGLFDTVDAVITCHAEGRTILKQELISRAVLEMDFHGKAAHAAGAPEKGINALDAAVLTINGINSLRQHVTPDVRIHGMITHGGDMVNTVPEFSRIVYGIRAAEIPTLEDVIERVLNCGRGGALMTGCRFEWRHAARPYLTVRHNMTLLEAFAQNLTILGESYLDYVPSSYSTDTGNVSQKAPTIHPYISIGGAHLIGHTPEFAEASHSESGYKGMIVAAKAMAMTGYDILTNAELRQKARAEFQG